MAKEKPSIFEQVEVYLDVVTGDVDNAIAKLHRAKIKAGGKTGDQLYKLILELNRISNLIGQVEIEERLEKMY